MSIWFSKDLWLQRNYMEKTLDSYGFIRADGARTKGARIKTTLLHQLWDFF